MGKHRSREAPRGRYQQVDLTSMSMTPPTARTLGNQLLSHHGSLSSADSSTLYNASSHPTSPLLSQRSPMHQLRQPRHTGVNRHGVVMPLEDDDDLLQPVYQEPFQIRGAAALDSKSEASAIISAVKKEHIHSVAAVEATTNVTSNENVVHSSLDNLKDPTTLQLMRKGKPNFWKTPQYIIYSFRNILKKRIE